MSFNTWLVRTVAAPWNPRGARLAVRRARPTGVAARMTVFAVSEPPDVRIEIQVGRVDLVATDRDDVVVTVSPEIPAAPATGRPPRPCGSTGPAEPCGSSALPG